MSFDEIDLDRVVADPDYRRMVIEFLNGNAGVAGKERLAEPIPAPVKRENDTPN